MVVLVLLFHSLCILLLLVLQVFGVAAWGPVFGPIKLNFGRVGTVLYVLERGSSYEHSSDHHPPPPPALVYSLSSTNGFSLFSSFGSDFLRDFDNENDGSGETASIPTTAIYYNDSLLWEPVTEDWEDDLLVGLLDDNNHADEMDCVIPKEFKIDEKTAADVMSYLGIQRARPIRVPTPSSESQFRGTATTTMTLPLLFSEWE